MDVNEVVGLARWMDDYVHPAMPIYEQLASALEQNAGGSSKVPLRDHLNAAKIALIAMPVEQLSYQQTDLLASMKVAELLGNKGWRFVERTVKEGNFDPASAATDIRQAKQRIDNSLTMFNQARQGLKGVGIVGEPEYSGPGKVTVRVRFKDEVEIVNVSELKRWTAEWYEISRGLAMAVGEHPEDVEVKGATSGSLILVLGTTLAVTSLIALIMKQVASTVKSSMEVAHLLQDWKMRRIADAQLENAMTARRNEIESGGVQDALNLIKEKIGERIKGDVENALLSSIEKMFSFTAKGGEVDLLSPPEPAADEGVDIAVADAIKIITENVEEMRALKAATQLLIEDKANEAPKGDEA